MAGRKTFTEELEIKKRYSDLSPKFFNILKRSLDSKNKEDNKWAVEQLNKAFVKMIPQAIEGGSENNPLVIKVVRYAGEDNQTIQPAGQGDIQPAKV